MEVQKVKSAVIKENYLQLLGILDGLEKAKRECRDSLTQLVRDEEFVFADTAEKINEDFVRLEEIIANEYSVLDELRKRGLNLETVDDAIKFYEFECDLRRIAFLDRLKKAWNFTGSD